MKAGFRGCSLLLILGIALLIVPPARAAEKRIALIIGIGAYQNAPPLANPANDAHDIGDALRRLNFDVDELYDPDHHALMEGVREFGIRRAERRCGGDLLCRPWRAGGSRELPAAGRREAGARARPAVRGDAAVADARRDLAGQEVGIVLLDACRNNPFIDRMSRSMTIADRSIATSPGLARVDNVPPNTLVAMATKANPSPTTAAAATARSPTRCWRISRCRGWNSACSSAACATPC